MHARGALFRSPSAEDLSGYMSAPPMSGPPSASCPNGNSRRTVSITRHRVPEVSSFSGTFACHTPHPHPNGAVASPSCSSLGGGRHWSEILSESESQDPTFVLHHPRSTTTPSNPHHHPPASPPPASRQFSPSSKPRQSANAASVRQPPLSALIPPSQRRAKEAQVRKAPSSFVKHSAPPPPPESDDGELSPFSDLASDPSPPRPPPPAQTTVRNRKSVPLPPTRVAAAPKITRNPNSNNRINNRPAQQQTNNTHGAPSSHSSSSSDSASQQSRDLAHKQQLAVLEERIKRCQQLIEDLHQRQQALQHQSDQTVEQLHQQKLWTSTSQEKLAIQSARIDDLWERNRQLNQSCELVRQGLQEFRSEWSSWTATVTQSIVNEVRSQQGMPRWCWGRVIESTLFHLETSTSDGVNDAPSSSTHQTPMDESTSGSTHRTPHHELGTKSWTLETGDWVFLFLPFAEVPEASATTFWARCAQVDRAKGSWINGWCKVAHVDLVSGHAGNFTVPRRMISDFTLTPIPPPPPPPCHPPPLLMMENAHRPNSAAAVIQDNKQSISDSSSARDDESVHLSSPPANCVEEDLPSHDEPRENPVPPQ